ncbi:MAG: inositol monophosphatase family protein [Rhodospirillales bacterium]
MLRTPLVNVMTAAAQKAARGLVRDFGEVEHLQVSKKGPSDFVSTADKKAEKILFEELQKARPKYGFLMEERGVIEGSDSSNRWIIDPLDGTTNFLHSIPQFAISIALERDGQIFAGVVYNPVSDEMFVAEKGQGAFLNGRRLRVSARRNIAESLFATGIPFLGRDNHDLFLKQLRAIMAVSAGVRRNGAASLDLAWVAAGRFEGFWEQNLQAWDMAAGLILVSEAGGFISDLAGGRDILVRGDIVAGNDAMHPVLLKTLREAAASGD